MQNLLHSKAADAVYWAEFGLTLIPIGSVSTTPAVELDEWRRRYSVDAVAAHFEKHTHDRIGAFLPSGVIGFRAIRVEFEGVLTAFLQSLHAAPLMWLSGKGSFYRMAPGQSVTDWHALAPDGVEIIGSDDILLLPTGSAFNRDAFPATTIDDLAIVSTLDMATPEGQVDIDQPASVVVDDIVDTPLAAMSVRGSASVFEERALLAKPLLGHVVMMGQATVWYAPPNSGKTLIMLALLLQAISGSNVRAENCYFINADDNEAGIAEKLRLLDDLGAHTLIPGEGGFEPASFADQLDAMAANDQCRGVVIVLDTIKKCADLMDKRESARFAHSVRRFTQKGGTFLGLAHTRKNPGTNGRAVYGGTTDLIEDSDAVFILNAPYDSAATGEKIVKFETFKKRGGGVEETYAYATDAVSYDELLASVRLVDPDDVERLESHAKEVDDQTIVDAVIACIDQGITMKMPLVAAVAEAAKISKRSALRVIERYQGNDGNGIWSYTVQARGAKVYAVVRDG
ncbi:AAA family ATPase [Sphingobium sp. BS19]|uniref:AAA family ATPase n=1 Tax=Sphingobium sp. BS19 TaxID=3018973 RepID=UPI0022EE4251|nr:AAA family ATPase [Sphingobium sp. BS19]GLI98893.1 hypothetical protein Sbs19_27110 [Sphingobium sp. BS19]